jgi:O-antigen ligase
VVRGDPEMNAQRGELAIFAPALALVVVALVFGGASRDNPLGWMAVELAGVAALMPALLRLPGLRPSRRLVAAFGLLALLIALPIVQLVPLPPGLWRHLPGRAPLAHAVALAGLPDAWRPMSLAPDETARACLFLLAPAGMFLAGVQCDWRRRGWLVAAVLGVALLSLLVGAVQVAGGEADRLRFYANAAVGLPSGFFANRNHQAAFMVAALALAASLSASEGLPGGLNRRPAVILALMLLLGVGAAATLSRAGVLLLGPVLVGGLLILRPQARHLGRIVPVIILIVAVAGVVAMVLALKGGAIFDRFENGEAGGGRLGLLPQVVALGQGLQPVGGGVGSFDLVYRATERLDQVDPFYLNHVHNDYIELWLEAGWPAVALLAGFGVWWLASAVCVWSGPERIGAGLARSGSLVTAALLAHAIVDYPLRTPALAVLFALACALMLDPPPRKD